MKQKMLDEQPNNAPILTRGGGFRVRGSSPISARKLAWQIRMHPCQAAEANYYLIQPNGHSNILRPSQQERERV